MACIPFMHSIAYEQLCASFPSYATKKITSWFRNYYSIKPPGKNPFENISTGALLLYKEKAIYIEGAKVLQ